MILINSRQYFYRHKFCLRQQADINSVVINVPALADASLADVLDAVFGHQKTCQYSIMDDGVFSRGEMLRRQTTLQPHFRVRQLIS